MLVELERWRRDRLGHLGGGEQPRQEPRDRRAHRQRQVDDPDAELTCVGPRARRSSTLSPATRTRPRGNPRPRGDPPLEASQESVSLRLEMSTWARDRRLSVGVAPARAPRSPDSGKIVALAAKMRRADFESPVLLPAEATSACRGLAALDVDTPVLPASSFVKRPGRARGEERAPSGELEERIERVVGDPPETASSPSRWKSLSKESSRRCPIHLYTPIRPATARSTQHRPADALGPRGRPCTGEVQAIGLAYPGCRERGQVPCV